MSKKKLVETSEKDKAYLRKSAVFLEHALTNLNEDYGNLSNKYNSLAEKASEVNFMLAMDVDLANVKVRAAEQELASCKYDLSIKLKRLHVLG